LAEKESGQRPKQFARRFAQISEMQPSNATAPAPSTDPDLARVVEAWPTLQAAIRQAVLKLIS
jgi:hypothetical protein